MVGLIYITRGDRQSIKRLIAFYGPGQRADLNGVRGSLAAFLSIAK